MSTWRWLRLRRQIRKRSWDLATTGNLNLVHGVTDQAASHHDQLEDCSHHGKEIPKPDADVAVVVVLLEPSTARIPTTDRLFSFEARRDLVLSIAPWVRDIVAPVAFSADSFKPLPEPGVR